MSSWGFAPRVSRMTFTASDVASSLESGLPVRIWGFVIANTGTSTTNVVTIRSADGNTVYYVHTFGNSETVIFDTKFIADLGISATVTGANFADFNICFFHSNAGS